MGSSFQARYRCSSRCSSHTCSRISLIKVRYIAYEAASNKCYIGYVHTLSTTQPIRVVQPY